MAGGQAGPPCTATYRAGTATRIKHRMINTLAGPKGKQGESDPDTALVRR